MPSRVLSKLRTTLLTNERAGCSFTDQLEQKLPVAPSSFEGRNPASRLKQPKSSRQSASNRLSTKLPGLGTNAAMEVVC